MKLEKTTGKVAKQWDKAKKKAAGVPQVLAEVEKKEKEFIASAKAMRKAVASLKPAGTTGKKVTTQLSVTGKVLQPKRVAVYLMTPANKMAKLIKPLLDGIRKCIEDVFNLPIVKQIFKALNWVIDQIWKVIKSALHLDDLFDMIADKLNPIGADTVRQLTNASEAIRDLGYQTVQPITQGISSAVPLDFQMVSMASVFGGDKEFQGADLVIPVGVIGFCKPADTTLQLPEPPKPRREEGLKGVCYGKRVRLRHKNTGLCLHSHNIKYPKGSKQQQVTCFGSMNADDLWIIKGPRKDGQRGERMMDGQVVKGGQTIRLEHCQTGRNLHSHRIKSHVTGQQEVSCYAQHHSGDSNDHWRVECKGAEWDVIRGKDAFAGKNAHVMTAANLDTCKRECVKRGFEAFVVWRGQAYFRDKSASECHTHLKAAKEATIYLRRGALQIGAAFKLIHCETNGALHSHKHNYAFHAPQQEVTCYGGGDSNDLWIIELA